MIEKVLEAYEEKIIGKNVFVQKWATMDKITKIVFAAIILSPIVITIYAFINPTMVLLIVVGVYVVVIHIATLILERIRRKKWKSSLEEYNNELNSLAVLLKEDFNLYEKNKIKQLIYKYYRDIENQETQKIKKSNNIEKFICTYIVPVIAFFVGKIDTTESSVVEWLVIGIVIIMVIIGVKYIYSSIVEFIEMISWNQLEKEKHFVLVLQDLLDRDFTIERDDLLL